MTGANKTKGSVRKANETPSRTPDTLIILENGKYILAEYTTTDSKREKKQTLYKKLETDLRKCFDEEKTGISITEIEKVV